MLVPNFKLALGLVFLALVAAGFAVGVALLTAPSLPEAPSTSSGVTRTTTEPKHSRHQVAPPTVRGPRAPRSLSNDSLAGSATPTRDNTTPIRWLGERTVVEMLGIATAAGTLLGSLVALVIVVRTVRRRVRNRRARTYERYEIRLSAHDETAPEDLEAAVEAIISLVRERADARWREGQPWLAFELRYSADGGNDAQLEWRMCVVCQPSVVRQLDAALASAYPAVRLGYDFVADPAPAEGEVSRPVYVERLRKHRSFVFALGRERSASRGAPAPGAPLIELIAQAQVAAARPSIVRLTLVPTLHAVERLAASLARGEANRSAREEQWGATEAGLRAPQRRRELEEIQRTQNRSLCWFELMIASDDAATCRAVTATVQALRGANRLHRRILDVRPSRTRDRFVTGDPPLLPATPVIGLRALLSSAEIATLIELPTARMRGVPVRRLMLPRIPAPPEALRAHGALAEPPVDLEPFDPETVSPERAAGAEGTT
jgi:hypothetical protein